MNNRSDPLLSPEENTYLVSLSPKEYQAYLIAKDHLGILLTLHNLLFDFLLRSEFFSDHITHGQPLVLGYVLQSF